MARILSRRANGAPPPVPEPLEGTPADEPDVALRADADQPTAVVPVVERSPELEEADAVDVDVAPDADGPAEAAVVAEGETATELPAGADSAPAASPTFLTRGKLRRRLRYLRRVREIGFRDLGGLVFDLDRFGRERPDLVELKLAGLKSIDAELRALEVALDDLREGEELFEPGVSACSRCGALHGSEAQFCPACGTPVHAPPAVAGVELPAAAPDSAPAESTADADQPPA